MIFKEIMNNDFQCASDKGKQILQKKTFIIRSIKFKMFTNLYKKSIKLKCPQKLYD